MRDGLGSTAIAFTVALALSLGIAELATRRLGLLDRVSPQPRALFRPGDAAELPYRLRPGADLDIGDVRIRVNRMGLRGSEIDVAPAAGTERWLVLGDSVVYGHRLPEEQSFPVLLEGELRRRGLRVEILNAAAPGYNTGAELAFLREAGLRLSPDALLLGVSLNDFAPTPRLTGLGFFSDDADESWLASRSELYALLCWVATFPDKGRLLSRLLGGEGLRGDWEALDRHVGVMHKRFYADPSGPGWDEVRASLEALRDLAQARGIELRVVIFPESDQLGDAPNLDPQARWTGLCQELALSCLDLQPAFALAASRGETDLFLDTQHPNARGFALSALATAEFLAP
jgi:lysophospholipase L1-like esterase